MSSRREEERNEKIIRGLMKLPPNRRCINCNSLGPQYVCTNFWTFVCTTCSGIHREFTHRVKSVSMSKFTSQEVDSLQKGGNQRARELYLKTWDLQSHRLPDNSNDAKVREFIKNVYVDRIYAPENSSDRPPTDPQGMRNHEDDNRRASSYHSYSQSPPYDFEYEERRYGKHAPTLTRKPGSDQGLYERNLSSFLSPSRFSDHANYGRFGNEGSLPRASDFSVSSGGYPFKSDVLSPSSQRDMGSPFSCESNGGRTLHPQRTVSSGSFGSFDSNSMSFKSVTSTGFLEAASPELEPPAEISHDKSSSFSSPAQPSVSGTFGGLDLFAAPFAPQNITSTPPTAFTEQQPSQVQPPSLFDLFSLTQQLPSASSSEKISDGVMPNEGWATGSNSQFPGSSLTQPIELFQEQSNHSSFTKQQSSQVQQPSLFGLLSSPTQQEPGASSSVKISDGVMLNEGGWASFDMAQNYVPVDTRSSAPAAVPVSHQYDSRNFNPFSFYQSSDSAGHDPAAATSSSFWHDELQDVETTTSSALTGSRAFATDHNPSNPFDLSYDSEMESGNMSQFWDMSSLQAALPNTQKPPSYAGDVNQSWFPQSPIQSFIPGGVALDHPSVNLVTISAEGPVASIGGNPFA